MKTDPEDNALSYEVFDRQLNNFYRMLHVLMEGWDDYSPQELTFDIRSLCTKANRLCHMAVQDLALQHSDIAHAPHGSHCKGIEGGTLHRGQSHQMGSDRNDRAHPAAQ